MGFSFSLIFAILTIIALSRVRKFYSGLKAVSKLPGPRVPFWPYTIPGILIPTTWWNPGGSYHWINRFTVYKYFSSEVFAVVPFLIGPPGIYVSNLDVAHQILGNGRSALTFVKSPSNPFLLEFWRSNIIYSQGDVWRKHRRVLGQAFHNTLYADVWAQTVRAYHDMTATEDWRKRDVVEIPVVQNLTFKLATLIIGQCGFGFPFDWASQAPLPDGYISIQESIRVVTSNAALLTSPKWMQRLPLKVFEKVSKARDEVMRFLEYQVAERRAALSGFPDDSEERSKDMFSLLVGANEAESEKVRMSDEEVVGNIFAMLFAGNETTAYAIAAALGCVSLHQDIQDEALKQIEEVVGYTHDPTVDDYPRLTKVLCIFFEAVRMFPVAHVILREAGEDTTLTIPNPVGEAVSKTIPILKGTKIIVDMVGIQYNPRYFDEPEKFKPSRWEGVSPDSEAFTAFGFGPRTCIGRKFAIVEAVCWLTMVLRDWRVEPLLRPGETEEMWAQRALDARAGITLYVSDIPVRFVRRAR
ncbi:cytochrome P450 family protein [Pleurotus pulmonarius]